MPRIRRLESATSTLRGYPLRADVVRGNGTPERDVDRLIRLEHLMEQIQQTLDTQFRRIASMQAELDLLRAHRR